MDIEADNGGAAAGAADPGASADAEANASGPHRKRPGSKKRKGDDA